MNAKIYTGNIQPNPKEYKVWVNDEGVIKTWNGTEWIEQSGESGGTASKYAPRYFKIDWANCSEDWKYVFSTGYNKDNIFHMLRIASTMKVTNADGTFISASQGSRPDSFNYNIVYISSEIKDMLGVNYTFCSFEQAVELVNMLSIQIDIPINLSMEGITEITEDEYYKID